MGFPRADGQGRTFLQEQPYMMMSAPNSVIHDPHQSYSMIEVNNPGYIQRVPAFTPREQQTMMYDNNEMQFAEPEPRQSQMTFNTLVEHLVNK